MYINFRGYKLASTSGENIAHVSSTSTTSESVFITEKLKTMNRVKKEVFLCSLNIRSP